MIVEKRKYRKLRCKDNIYEVIVILIIVNGVLIRVVVEGNCYYVKDKKVNKMNMVYKGSMLDI